MPDFVKFPAILHGGDYNPEQWPENVWDDDVHLMQQAHVNVVTMPVFGWVTLQPNEDTYTFEWLDRAIEKLHSRNIRICMATATASTPAWLDQKYPDILRTDQKGQKLKHGNRHSFCPNSPNFRRLSVELARRLAERYADHPALIAWHVGNEYGGTCYCDQCAEAFREWLKARYGTLDEVNRRWYTAFWGHTFTDWRQIETPTENGERSQMSLLIDYDRFQSESVLNCYRAERDALRPYAPDIPITTNLMGHFKPLDYYRWAQEMDVVSWDSYPRRGEEPYQTAFSHSLMRGLKEGQPFMLMEQTPSQQNWQPYNALKRPGIMRLWSYQAMAHGADTVMYFQWRRSRGGCEKYHGAVVEHAGREDARVFQEVAGLGKELEALGTRTLGGRVSARAAILFDWENWWAVEYSIGPSVDLKYLPQVERYYAALFELGIPADVVSPESDLSQYDLVVAPVLYMVKPGVAEKLEKFVEAGGVFVTTYFSGIADETDLVYPGGYPGPLKNLLGIWVEELDVLSPQESNSIRFETPFGELSGSHRCGMLCDRLHLEGAAALAHYEQDFYCGEPVLTVNQFGKGKAYYFGTVLEVAVLTEFFRVLCREQGITQPFGGQPPAGVEIMPRICPEGDTLYYVLNHNSAAQTVSLPQGRYRDLISGADHTGELPLATYGAAILYKIEA